ncbi:Phage protein [Staphylococcus gallinarum]|uniref:Phage protein n=1 Tax=Staphylococcus gallinarum TaxID=1293 RepID=A0A380FHW5_STAGA|nr:Phage protein [Staphylococcus gallinarum]
MENTMRIRDKVYEFPDEYMEQANLNGISKSQIRKRLEYNWTVKEACYVPQGTKLDDYRFYGAGTRKRRTRKKCVWQSVGRKAAE